MEPNTTHRSDSKPFNKFSSPSTTRVSSPSSFPFQPVRSKFIGSFIHEVNFDPRPVKQRPSKRARQRIRKRLAKLELEDKANKVSPESGYDTTSGDCQTPRFSSPEKSSFKLTETHQSQSKKKEVKQERNNLLPAAANASNEGNTVSSRARTTSVSSVSSLITDKNLRRPLKDLHRCEVSIAKYEAMLSDKCEEGQVQLRDVFSRLRHQVDERETDLRQELTTVRDNAAAILERRKRTALYLRQATEQVANLEEPQVEELKQQIKQFVTDRRVDEEIGTITRFQADLDDILRHVMGFGKVNNVRHLYTEWEENPGEAIEMSKHRLSFPISAHHRFTPSIDSEVDSSSPGNSISSNNIASSCNSSSTASLLTEKETSSLSPPSPVEQNNNSKKPKEDSPVLKELTQKIGQQANDETDGQSASGNNEPVAMKPDAVADGNKTNKPICALTLNIETTKTEETIEEEEGLDTIEDNGQSDKKITPEELLLKQARVRESLKMQGVFLYDPITGEGPPPTPPPQATPLDMGIMADHDLRPLSPASRKKKTPTQLRRERKKRQKEREKRQNEIERKVREDSSKSISSGESSDSKTPDIPNTDKSSSGVEAESKVNWSHAPLGGDDRDASSENSEGEDSPIDSGVVQIAEETLTIPADQQTNKEATNQDIPLHSEDQAIITVETPSSSDHLCSDMNNELDQGPTVSTDDYLNCNQVEPDTPATNSSTSEISIPPSFEDESILSSEVPSLKQLATVVATVTEVTSLPSNQLQLDDPLSQPPPSIEQPAIGAPPLDSSDGEHSKHIIADSEVPTIDKEDDHQPSIEQQTIGAPPLDSSDGEHSKHVIADSEVPTIDKEDDHQPSIEQQTIGAPPLDSSDGEHSKHVIADSEVPTIDKEDDHQPSIEQQTIGAPPLDSSDGEHSKHVIADSEVPAIDKEDDHQPSIEQQTIGASPLDSSDEEHSKHVIADSEVPTIDKEDDHQPSIIEQQTIGAPPLDSSDGEHSKHVIADSEVPAIDKEDDHQPSIEQQTIGAPPLDSSDGEHSKHVIADSDVPAIDKEDDHQPSIEQQTIGAPPLDSSDGEHGKHVIADSEVPAIDKEDDHQPSIIEQQTIGAPPLDSSDGEHSKHVIADSEVPAIDKEDDHQLSIEQQTIGAPPLDSSDGEHSKHVIADSEVPAIDKEDDHQPSIEQQTIGAPPLDSSDGEHGKHVIADSTLDMQDVSSIDREE